MGTKCVGQTVAKFIEHLNTDVGVPWDNMTIVSHSLGSQVAGATGNELGLRLKTLIALDPSYGLAGVNNLKNTSAEHVIVLHTSMALAQYFPTGTADFYVNTGVVQPGCIAMWAPQREQCAHYRSVELFNEALENPKAFLAKETKGEQEDVYFSHDTKVRGVFAFKTRGEKPFSIESS
uniref:Lipase domain-containing protein n=1 Tax=Lygus hesperus TaxID=30085 RepID=A0A0A9XLH9_LYGHE